MSWSCVSQRKYRRTYQFLVSIRVTWMISQRQKKTWRGWLHVSHLPNIVWDKKILWYKRPQILQVGPLGQVKLRKRQKWMILEINWMTYSRMLKSETSSSRRARISRIKMKMTMMTRRTRMMMNSKNKSHSVLRSPVHVPVWNKVEH